MRPSPIPTAPILTGLVFTGLLLAAPAVRAGILSVEIVPELVGDHELEGDFEIGSGCTGAIRTDDEGSEKGAVLPCYEGSILLTFESPALLVASSLDISAEIVDPDDSGLNSRLPPGVFVPEEFPVLIRIDDDNLDLFTFSDALRLEIRTRELEFEFRSPLRLFRAEDKGPFEDFTRTTGVGSYRVAGSFGTFSEFLIAMDLRPIRSVVAAKFVQVKSSITTYTNSDDISGPVAAALLITLGKAEDAAISGDVETAVDHLYTLLDELDLYNGDGISDDWDPLLGNISVVGVLFGQVESLVFSVEDQGRPQPVSSGGTRQQLTTQNHGLEVTVDFAKTTSFQPESLDIEATEIDPFDPDILARLPSGVSIDPNFPVAFTIGVDADRRPAARGDWQVLFRTRDLSFLLGSPFRLFEAAFGDNFTDATTSLGVGSLIAGAHVGRFDEFAQSTYLLVKDQRSTATVISRKFAQLATMLDIFELSPTVGSQLEARLGAARDSYDGGDPRQAIVDLDDFLAIIDDNAGVALDDIWRADDPRTNHAGLLAAKAKTLQFSLALDETPLDPDPADVNRDGVVDAADVFTLIQQVYCPSGCT